MKFPILKGVSIVSGVFVVSFVFAFGAYQISVQRKFQQKVEAFKQGGINVVYQGVVAHLRPISLDTFESDVEKILPLPLQERRSAAIRFEKNHYIVDEDVSRVSIDGDSLKNDLEGRIRTFSSVPIEVKLKTESAEVTKSDLEGALPELKKHFNNKFTLTSKDFSIPVWFRDHLDLLVYRKTLNPNTGNVLIKIEFQGELFAKYVAQDWGKIINNDPVKVKISRDEKGKIVFDGHGKDGRILDNQKLQDVLTEAINSQDINIEKSKLQLPIEEKVFEVEVSEDLKKIGITEVVSVGHTSYYGSPQNRMFNINVGVGKFNGVVIAPGEIFSFNSHLGPVDGAHGFLKELVIKPEGTLPEFGGGLC
ncbi:MAG: VanW family protein, partial [Candidatus Gracilibacteria bacterium]